MNKKPELVVTPVDVPHIKDLSEAGATAIVIGESRYGLRLAGEFSRRDVSEATKAAHDLGMNIYVAMNAIFHNERLKELPDYMKFVRDCGVDAVIFGDPSIVMIQREVAPHLPLHWSTETTGTNWYMANYWGRKGAKRALLAREINMEEIIECKEHAEVEIEVQVHGMLCMFQSKRKLVQNYFEFQGKNLQVEKRDHSRHLVLYDPERKVDYPIFEDINGTHIMSPQDECIIDDLGEMLEAGIDSFKIDGILHEKAYTTAVTKLYREAIDLFFDDPDAYEEQKETFLKRVQAIQPKLRPLGTGFFYKETIY